MVIAPGGAEIVDFSDNAAADAITTEDTGEKENDYANRFTFCFPKFTPFSFAGAGEFESSVDVNDNCKISGILLAMPFAFNF